MLDSRRSFGSDLRSFPKERGLTFRRASGWQLEGVRNSSNSSNVFSSVLLRAITQLLVLPQMETTPRNAATRWI